MDSTTLIVSAGIQAAVGFFVWIAIRRPIDQLSDDNKAMRVEIAQLRDNRIAAIERAQAEHERKIQTVVPSEFCKEQHRGLSAGIHEFRAAVVDLAHVQTELKNTAAFVSEVNGRVMGLISDVAGIESLEKRVTRLEDRK